MKKFVNIAFIFALLISACSPSARLARLQKKHPELFPDTVKISGYVQDTASTIFDLDLKKFNDNNLDIFGTKEDSIRWFQRKGKISVLVLPEATQKEDSTFLIIPQKGGSGKAIIRMTEDNTLQITAKPEAKQIPFVAKAPVVPKAKKPGSIQIFLIGVGIMFIVMMLIVIVRKFF